MPGATHCIVKYLKPQAAVTVAVTVVHFAPSQLWPGQPTCRIMHTVAYTAALSELSSPRGSVDDLQGPTYSSCVVLSLVHVLTSLIPTGGWVGDRQVKNDRLCQTAFVTLIGVLVYVCVYVYGCKSGEGIG